MASIRAIAAATSASLFLGEGDGKNRLANTASPRSHASAARSSMLLSAIFFSSFLNILEA